MYLHTTKKIKHFGIRKTYENKTIFIKYPKLLFQMSSRNVANLWNLWRAAKSQNSLVILKHHWYLQWFHRGKPMHKCHKHGILLSRRITFRRNADVSLTCILILEIFVPNKKERLFKIV